MSKILWQADNKNNKYAITQLRKTVEMRFSIKLQDYQAFHKWSIENRPLFWSLLWDEFNIIGEKGERLFKAGKHFMEDRFLPDSKLNYAENLMRYYGAKEAIIFRSEDKLERRYTWQQINTQVSKVQQWLQEQGIEKGDRVAAMMPNMAETIICMLAVTGLGAIWSSCSPDFGVNGVVDRFGQIEPKVFITTNGYYYAGKWIDVQEKVQDITSQLPTLKKSLIIPLDNGKPINIKGRDFVTWNDILVNFIDTDIIFEKVEFDAPLFILFSSGTTGVPKCIVHSVGGTLLQHLKEHRYHCDIKEDDKMFYFTTCGWMMWNWLVSGLASGATLLLYDGSPFATEPSILLHYIEKEQATFFGTSAKYIDALKKADLQPIKTHDLTALKMIASTGSPLLPESYDYIYNNVKKNVALVSISGGTDIVSCFVLGNPELPVHKGEIQCAGLAMAVEVWNEKGKKIIGEKGELVCTKSFPSMPIYFWNDPHNEKYKKAYFSQFENIWAHGDFAEITKNNGFIIHGRSDAVLNPGGVRIGTAEIYRQVEKHNEVLESLCVGQDWEGDVRVVLFVKLRDGVVLDDLLAQKIKNTIRENASPRHVPAKIIAVPDIPRTKSGKIVELAVRDIIHGKVIANLSALANPEILDYYKDIKELKAS
jgi:acetoacetyl-CoA synthetase